MKRMMLKLPMCGLLVDADVHPEAFYRRSGPYAFDLTEQLIGIYINSNEIKEEFKMKTSSFFRWSGRAKMAVPVLLALFLAVGPAGSSFAQDFEVYADIRPCKCPNPLNLLAQGVVPVAISVTSVTGDYDAGDIDPWSVTLEGVPPICDPPLEPQIRDVTTPYEAIPQNCNDCWAKGSDGVGDLLLFFDASAVVDSLPTAEEGCYLLMIEGNIVKDGDVLPFEAWDSVKARIGNKP